MYAHTHTHTHNLIYTQTCTHARMHTWMRVDVYGQGALYTGLSLIDQLDAGVRYIDFRMIWTAPANASSSAAHDFYVNHRIQTAETALWYLRQLKNWLEAHPGEIVRIDISRHGGPTFPYTPSSALQQFFSDFVELFSPMLHNHTRFPTATTSIGELVRNNQRLLASIVDFENVTAARPDLRELMNEDLPSTSCGHYPEFSRLAANLDETAMSCFFGKKVPPQGPPRFSVLQLNGDPPDATYKAAIEVFLTPSALNKGLVKKCAATLNFTLLSGKWCPGSFLEYARLQGYWAQFLLEEFVKNYTKPGAHLPNLVMVNGFGANGTLEIETDSSRRYALIDTTLLANVRAACQNRSRNATLCAVTEASLLKRQARYPIQRWEDHDTGRQPAVPTDARMRAAVMVEDVN